MEHQHDQGRKVKLITVTQTKCTSNENLLPFVDIESVYS